MINNIRFKIIAGKINKIKIPEFYTIFAPKCLINNKTMRLRPGQGQMFEDEAEAKILASRPLWPRVLSITATFSFQKLKCKAYMFVTNLITVPWSVWSNHRPSVKPSCLSYSSTPCLVDLSRCGSSAASAELAAIFCTNHARLKQSRPPHIMSCVIQF